MEDVMSFEDVKSREDIQYLTFALGNDLYGMRVDDVREVIEYYQIAHIARVPLVPEYIKGITNLRGEVVPVIDLSSRFFGHKSEITRRTCVVIIEIEEDNEKILIGAIIDAVNAVIDIPPDDIEQTPGFGAKIRSDFISGIGKVSDIFIILLNIDNVLDIEELSNFDRIARGSNSLLV